MACNVVMHIAAKATKSGALLEPTYSRMLIASAEQPGGK
jgi:hypothetical protein